MLRTSCNRITHAFCAFKAAEDGDGIREDHRHVFADAEKRTIQVAPASFEAVAIVTRLLARRDIDHPGRSLHREYSIDPTTLEPAIQLDDYRYTFFVWLDERDALRCSIDRYQELVARAEAGPGPVLAVGHGGFIKTLFRILGGSDQFCVTLYNSCLSLVEWRRGRWHVVYVNLWDHLPAELRTT